MFKFLLQNLQKVNILTPNDLQTRSGPSRVIPHHFFDNLIDGNNFWVFPDHLKTYFRSRFFQSNSSQFSYVTKCKLSGQAKIIQKIFCQFYVSNPFPITFLNIIDNFQQFSNVANLSIFSFNKSFCQPQTRQFSIFLCCLQSLSPSGLGIFVIQIFSISRHQIFVRNFERCL